MMVLVTQIWDKMYSVYASINSVNRLQTNVLVGNQT